MRLKANPRERSNSRMMAGWRDVGSEFGQVSTQFSI